MFNMDQERYETWRKTRIGFVPNVLGGKYEVFLGTRLSVLIIAGRLLGGDTRDLILEDYPYLNQEDLDFSLRYYNHYLDGSTNKP